MKDILLIAHFTHVPGEAGNSRFNYIAKKINKEKTTVEVVTTSFSHRTKKERKVSIEQKRTIDYKLTMLEEPGYNANISFRRFYSHYVFSKNLNKYLRNRKKPDLIYCAVPSLDAAYVAAKYARKNDIKFIIDVQDLWPEAFKMIFKIPILSDVVFFPLMKKANYIYSIADEIVAVSQTYLERALRVNKDCPKAYSVYLGTELDYFDSIAKKNKVKSKPESEVWLVYIGTLGHSYDLYSVIDALKILKDKGVTNLKFILMGDGPLRSKYESYAKSKGIISHFTGRLEYSKMVEILTVCDIAVNPIRSGSAGSIINKVGDYAAAGLPVLNTQDSKEYRDLIDTFNAGINCDSGNSKKLAEKLILLYENSELRRIKGENNRKLAEIKFDREKTYQSIIKSLSN